MLKILTIFFFSSRKTSTRHLGHRTAHAQCIEWHSPQKHKCAVLIFKSTGGCVEKKTIDLFIETFNCLFVNIYLYEVFTKVFVVKSARHSELTVRSWTFVCLRDIRKSVVRGSTFNRFVDILTEFDLQL